jgi:sugar/nucleoside kinase (ribokinase family)
LVDTAAQNALLEKAKALSEPKIAIGGSSGNTVFGLARLGVQTSFLGVLGVDADAESSTARPTRPSAATWRVSRPPTRPIPPDVSA